MKKTILFITILFLIIIGRVFYLRIYKYDYYKSIYDNKINNYIYGTTARRGRILDCNGKVLVDNEGVKTIYFNDIETLSKKEKIDISYSLANILDIESANELNQRKFYLANNDIPLSEEETKLYNERKINLEQVLDIKLKKAHIIEFDEIDKKAAQIYYLINKDYKYTKRVIKSNVSEEEYAKVLELNLKGITGEVDWIRVYPYKDTLKSILGNVGKIYSENKDYYLNEGYSLSDTVGISYLEYQYDNYLRGQKAIYKVNDGRLLLIKNEKKGNDIYLNIDIDIQLELEKNIKEEIKKAKKSPNTEYFSELFASISNPKTGNIIALAGIRYNKNKTFSDITSDIISSSFTVGSVVKGATISVGYNNDLITPGKYITDSCVKLYLVPQKCSFKRLGRINDITALAYSSNYYQYMIAIKLANKKYHNNIKLNVTEKEFDIYRNTLKEYGLGSYTGIDLPNEVSGISGKTIADDLLLNLAIGQYDTYTNIELLQYINTIATGKRLKLNLVDRIVSDNEILYKQNSTILNELSITEDNLNRIRKGFREVIRIGTGASAAEEKIKPAGKTGTSESFYDSNNDKKMDIKTISTSLALYYPYDDPKYSIAIIAPNISHDNGKSKYTYSITKHVSRSITNFLFEKY